MIPVIGLEECTGCGNCVEACPPEALSLKGDKVHLAADLCEECGFCAPECPIGTISIPFPRSTDK
ncbi:MAG: 4Fe-4S binding protein [Syntrophobacterales bacterium]|nr:4Fe-4S binding protein [Syntrophobacterales bacterium]